MASAYVAVNRPEKALRLLRNARRLAESSEIPVIFSPSVYTYVARKEFLDEVDTRIKDIEGEHKEAADAAVPTILTAIKAHEKYIITFKEGRTDPETCRERTWGGHHDFQTCRNGRYLD